MVFSFQQLLEYLVWYGKIMREKSFGLRTRTEEKTLAAGKTVLREVASP